MSKRISGPPRRPRNPVARAVRTPQYRQRVEPSRKRKTPPPDREEVESALTEATEPERRDAEKDTQAG